MIGILIAGATLFGVGAHASASSKNSEASRTNDMAREMIEDAKKMAEEAKNKCSESLNRLAAKKAMVLQGNMNRFVTAYSKIGKVNFRGSEDLFELADFSAYEIANIHNLCSSVEKSSVNAVASGASGALLAVGAVDALAGGAVLGSVTLAGGTAVAGGAVLGALAAPVFAVTGLVSASEASANLERANGNFDKALAYQDQCETYQEVTQAVGHRCDLFSEALAKIDGTWFSQAVAEVERIVKSKKGLANAWKNLTGQPIYTREEMGRIASAAALAKTVKTIIDTNILDSHGNLTEESDIVIDAIQGEMKDGKVPVNMPRLAEIQKTQKERIERIQQSQPKSNVFTRLLRRTADWITESRAVDKVISVVQYAIGIAVIAAVCFAIFIVGKKVVSFVGDVASEFSKRSPREYTNTDGIVDLSVSDIAPDDAMTEEEKGVKYQKYREKFRKKKGVEKADVEDILGEYFYYDWGENFVSTSAFFGFKKEETVYQYQVHHVSLEQNTCMMVLELGTNDLTVAVSRADGKGGYFLNLYSYDDYFDILNKSKRCNKQYVFSNSSYKKLKKSKVKKMSKSKLRKARNEIYARHGRLFKDKKLQKYFNKKKWYYGYIHPEDFSDGEILNKVEKYNIALIKKYEHRG